jgi:hypothetical protein
VKKKQKASKSTSSSLQEVSSGPGNIHLVLLKLIILIKIAPFLEI